jgi:hypothetical protein
VHKTEETFLFDGRVLKVAAEINLGSLIDLLHYFVNV